VTHDQQIDFGADVLLAVLHVLTRASPLLAFAEPFITRGIKHEVDSLKRGIADGSIISDGRGGFVPATNSRYDPNTGLFID
jgi:hypothetical protein